MSTDMENFIGLSAVLTGFNANILSPFLDPVDIKSEYLAIFKEKIGNDNTGAPLVDSILKKFSELNAQQLDDDAIGDALLNDDNGAAFVLACRKLIFLWYSGAWPTVVPGNSCEAEFTASNMVSAKSYTTGLVWQVMQSHPMGDSNYVYGYWSEKPALLSDYTENTSEGDA